MGFRINTNVSSLTAQRSLRTSNNQQSSSLARLASGSRIMKAADDSAGLAISEKLKANIRSIKQAGRNASDGISLIQTAEGGLNEISSVLIRLRELSMQSSSDTVGDSERALTDLEYQNLKQEIQRIAESTEFNGKKLLNGASDQYDFQIGIGNDQFQDRISYATGRTNASLGSLGIDQLNVASKGDAQGSLGMLDEAIRKVSGQRADMGAIQNRLVSTSNNLEVMEENLSAANSRIRDTDFAAETAESTRLNILNKAGTAVLAQANVQTKAALDLIG